MLNIKNNFVSNILDNIHNDVERLTEKADKSSRDTDTFILQSRIIEILCNNHGITPQECADILFEKYCYNTSVSQIIRTFKSMGLKNSKMRKDVLVFVDNLIDLYVNALKGDEKAFIEFDKLRDKKSNDIISDVKCFEKIFVIGFYIKNPEVNINDDTSKFYCFGNTLSKYLMYSMVDAVTDTYGFQNNTKKSNKKKSNDNLPKLNQEEAADEIRKLRDELDRTNMMLKELQKEFDELIQESKIEEMAEFFGKLNSEHYGYILDELIKLIAGVKKLRKANYELPLEINGMIILINNFIKFIRDSHIDPMMKTGSCIDVKASDIEACEYSGTPFDGNEQIKRVEVLSPGWIMRDTGIQISQPKVKEV